MSKIILRHTTLRIWSSLSSILNYHFSMMVHEANIHQRLTETIIWPWILWRHRDYGMRERLLTTHRAYIVLSVSEDVLLSLFQQSGVHVVRWIYLRTKLIKIGESRKIRCHFNVWNSASVTEYKSSNWCCKWGALRKYVSENCTCNPS